MTLVKRNNGHLNELFDELFNSFPTSWGRDSQPNNFLPPVNIYETEDAFHLDMNAAGRKKEDFKLELNNGLLTISFEKQEKNEEKTAKIVRREFNFTSFKRSFNLDEKIDTEKIEAKYENGILQVILPKKEVQKPLVKQISIA
ncbi:MAG: Hsp20/alpha crystallin family protein [Chitinophagaceae bacterium]